MESEFLSKIRKLNWVLSETTTGSLSYEDLSKILCEIMNANIYILDSTGRVLGVAYSNEKDTSAFEDELGVHKVPEEDNRSFLSMESTSANLIGEHLTDILGRDYSMTDKYHSIVPVICGGQRLGTIIVARYYNSYSDEEIALCEYGATVVGLEIQRNIQLERAEERRLRMAVDMAVETLSFSEKDALQKIMNKLENSEGIIVASKIAAEYQITNSVIVNALRKLESASILECKSLGMKGTFIKVINPYLNEVLHNQFL